MGKKYIYRGRVLFVGKYTGTLFTTMFIGADGGTFPASKRGLFPPRRTEEEAQADLDKFASTRLLHEVREEEHA